MRTLLLSSRLPLRDPLFRLVSKTGFFLPFCSRWSVNYVSFQRVIATFFLGGVMDCESTGLRGPLPPLWRAEAPLPSVAHAKALSPQFFPLADAWGIWGSALPSLDGHEDPPELFLWTNGESRNLPLPPGAGYLEESPLSRGPGSIPFLGNDFWQLAGPLQSFIFADGSRSFAP